MWMPRQPDSGWDWVICNGKAAVIGGLFLSYFLFLEMAGSDIEHANLLSLATRNSPLSWALRGIRVSSSLIIPPSES
jgi:hypothetical protein